MDVEWMHSTATQTEAGSECILQSTLTTAVCIWSCIVLWARPQILRVWPARLGLAEE